MYLVLPKDAAVPEWKHRGFMPCAVYAIHTCGHRVAADLNINFAGVPTASRPRRVAPPLLKLRSPQLVNLKIDCRRIFMRGTLMFFYSKERA